MFNDWFICLICSIRHLPFFLLSSQINFKRKKESLPRICAILIQCLHTDRLAIQINGIYIYIYIYIYFIIQRVKARAIPCPHQPPSRGDNTVSVAQGGTATPGATKQLLPPDRVLRESYIYIYIYIYIYTPDQLNAENTLDVNLHFLSAVCDLKNAFTFGGWCNYAFTVTVSYVITRERWFRGYYLRAENFLAFDQIQLDAY